MISVAKEVLFERVKGWQIWQNQQQALTRKRELKARMELSGRTEKSQQFSDDVKEHETKADKMERDFLDMSKNFRDEYNFYCVQRRDDIKRCFTKYLESLLTSEQKV